MRGKLTVVWQRLVAAWGGIPRKLKMGGLIAGIVLAAAAGAGWARLSLTRTAKPVGVTQTVQQLAPQGYEKLQIAQRKTPAFALKPESANKYGIALKNSFSLTTVKPVGIDFIKQHLKTSVPMELQAISAGEIKMIPQQTLATGQEMKITLEVKGETDQGQQFDRDYGWAFQAQPKFAVITSLPGDKKTGVPVNTGIEIVFNQDDYKDPGGKITISPAIEFRTERHNETLAIVPLSPLAPATVYKVTLKSGLDLASRSDPLTADFSWTFQTEPAQIPEGKSTLNVTDDQVQTTPGEKAGMKVYKYNWDNNQLVHTEVFKFNNADEWLSSRKDIDEAKSYWYQYYQEKHPVDVSKTSKVMTADLAMQTTSGGSDYDKIDYLQLPAALNSGLYLVQFSVNQKIVGQVWLQSTYLSGYVSVGKEQTVVWANNLQEGKAVEGAQVRAANSPTSYTSSDGVAVFASPAGLFDKGQHYIDVYVNEENRVLLPITSMSDTDGPGKATINDYWTYFYNERRIYHPNDTVNFWGVVKGRNSGQASESAEISLISGYGDSAVPIVKTVSPVASNGSFIGKLNFSGLPEGWYSVEVKVAGISVASSGISVEKFEKPEMKIEVTGDKKVVFAGDKVTFTGKVQFFDETPVRKVDMGVSNSDGDQDGEKILTTDDKGEVKYDLITNYRDGGNYPRYESVEINPKTAGMGQIEGDGTVFVFGSHLLLSGEGKQSGNQANVNVRVNKVDLTRYKVGTREEMTGDPATGQALEMKITKKWWERTENGTYYDFVEKVTRPAYSYTQKQEVVATKKLTTDGKGEIAYNFEMEKDRSYEAALTTTDDLGRAEKISQYFYNYGWSGYQPEQNDSPIIDLGRTDNQYSLDEPVNAVIKQAGKEYQGNDKTRYLFLVAMRGRIDFFATNQAKMEIPFAAKHIPNAFVGGVIFTGKGYTTVSGPCVWQWYCGYMDSGRYFNAVTIAYRMKDSQMTVKITADKDKYLPGETANLTATAATKGGTPLEGVTVNAVLVDEALKAIGGVVEPSVLESLYKQVPSLVYYSYYSHQPITGNSSGAEKGGGGGNREIFKDTAFFGQAVTGNDGKANIAVKLPDNLTTWIIYAQGVNQALEAGQTESKIIVSKDFFVTSNFAKEFLTSDKPKLAANSFGRALLGGKVNYTMQISQNGQEISKNNLSGQANKQAAFNLPKLNSGEYKATLEGTAGGNSDGVVYPFKVVESHINFLTGKKWTLTAGQKLAGPNLGEYNKDQMVQLQISDKGRGEYYWALKNYCWTSSNRIEKILAKTKASNDLVDKLNETGCAESGSLDVSSWQNTDGGLGQVKWGSSDLATTVWAIYSGGQGYDKTKMTDYLNGRTTANTLKEKIYAWWGLEMLGQSHMAELQAAAEAATGFEEKSTAALALQSTGDNQRAQELYWEIMADYAYRNAPYVRIQRDEAEGVTNLDNQLRDTATALLLGSKVSDEYNQGMRWYLRDYVAEIKDVVIDLAKIEFAEAELNKLPAEKTDVSVSIDGVQKTNVLNNWCNCYTTPITPEQLGSVNIQVKSGKAEAAINYYGNAKTMNQTEKDKRLQISRAYEKAFGSGAITTGDIIRITLKVNVDQNNGPIGEYKINDYLPAGFTYLNNPETFGLTREYWWISESSGQVSGYYYNSRWWQDMYNKQIVYFARAAAAGTYNAEPAFIQYQADPTIFMSTNSDQVTIEP